METCELYRHFDCNGALLYIGIARNTARRLGWHNADWKRRIARTEIQTFPSRAEAMEAERLAIVAERPKFNVQHAPRRGMSPDEYRAALATLGLTQNAIGELLGVHRGSGRRWAVSGVTGPAEILLRLLVSGEATIGDVAWARDQEAAGADPKTNAPGAISLSQLLNV